MVLKKENDIYIYFEAIRQMEPERVLDIGMFLKRAGSVSRKIMGREIPESVWLDGIDFFPEMNFLVWENVYNRILSPKKFFEERSKDAYGLAVLLGTEGICEKEFFWRIIEKAPECARYFLVDSVLDFWKENWSEMRMTDLKVGDEVYFLLDFGVKKYGYQNICNDA